MRDAAGRELTRKMLLDERKFGRNDRRVLLHMLSYVICILEEFNVAKHINFIVTDSLNSKSFKDSLNIINR